MKTSNQLFLFVVITTAVIFFFGKSSATECYDCNFCGTPKNKTCVASQSCYTARVEAFAFNLTWRGCSEIMNTSTSFPYCETKAEFKGQKLVHICYCTGDKCNNKVFSGSPVVGVSMATLFISLFLAYFKTA